MLREHFLYWKDDGDDKGTFSLLEVCRGQGVEVRMFVHYSKIMLLEYLLLFHRGTWSSSQRDVAETCQGQCNTEGMWKRVSKK